MSVKSVSDIELKDLATFTRNSGKLAALQFQNNIPWGITRVFFITSLLPETRGGHAHIKCNQAFFCNSGQVKIICRDGTNQSSFELTTMECVLFVPAGIWVDVVMSEQSSLTVLTDLPYDESDYINKWDEYLEFRGSM